MHINGIQVGRHDHLALLEVVVRLLVHYEKFCLARHCLDALYYLTIFNRI